MTEVSKMPSISLNPFSGVLWDRREPFKQLWITLSGIEHSKNKEKKKKKRKERPKYIFKQHYH